MSAKIAKSKPAEPRYTVAQFAAGLKIEIIEDLGHYVVIKNPRPHLSEGEAPYFFEALFRAGFRYVSGSSYMLTCEKVPAAARPRFGVKP